MNPFQQINQFLTSYPYLLPVFFIWTTTWKGLALWHAAKNNQKYWFIPLMIVNFLGLPEIVYLLFFQTKGKWIEKIKKSSRS